MTCVLVVNADDFGLTEGTNRAILDAYRDGIVTSTSLLANGYAFDHAVEIARKEGGLGIGVHLTLTEGPPVAHDVSELKGGDGKLPLSNQPFVRALVSGSLPRSAIRREFEAQIAKVVGAGITPTHVDGHKYIHVLPGISQIAAEAAQQFGIRVMRVPHRLIDALTRPARLPGMVAIRLLGAAAYRVARRAGLRSSDRVAGFIDTGHLNQAAIRRLLRTARPGVTELLCHPAYRSPQLEALFKNAGYRWIGTYDFDEETRAVSKPAIRREIEAAGWTLRGFDCLTSNHT